MATLIFELRAGSRKVELLPDEQAASVQITPWAITINGREVLRRAEVGGWQVVDTDIDLDGLYDALEVYI